MRWFLLSFILFSLLEIGLLIWLGSRIGVWWVLLLIILTASFGLVIGRKQGFVTWKRAIQSMERNQVPAAELVDSVCIIIGASLLVTPGLISDVIGLSLLLPFSRTIFKRYISKILQKLVQSGPIIYRRF